MIEDDPFTCEFFEVMTVEDLINADDSFNQDPLFEYLVTQIWSSVRFHRCKEKLENQILKALYSFKRIKITTLLKYYHSN